MERKKEREAPEANEKMKNELGFVQVYYTTCIYRYMYISSHHVFCVLFECTFV